MVLQNKTEYWGNSYGYDAWGNLLQKTITKCGAEHMSVTADGHNWLHASGTDYQYDAAGNMTYDATASLSYTFDQENRLTGAAGYTYTYDSDGNRVRKSNSSTGTLYWYMTPGIVGESDLSGNLTDEYVFFNGERVARKSTNGVFYYFSDRLKTASVITDSQGNIKSESDFYPWGGELQFVSDSNHYKFTGKERDQETGLDYYGARYYSNGLGRWVSADWSPTPIPIPYADFHDPQTLNLYQFVGGNPASKADPDGHDWPSWSDVGNFITGAANAYGSDNLLGAGRMDQGTSAGKLGAAFGDAAATVQGVGETLLGGTGEVAGFLLDATGVGAIAGVPINIASAGLIAHGVTTGVVGGAHLAKDANQSGGSKTHEETQENLDKIKDGKAPTGTDGHPVELHHDGQKADSPLKPMTRTDHRLGGNFKKNHPNTGQQKSQISPSQRNKQRQQFWKDQSKKQK